MIVEYSRKSENLSLKPIIKWAGGKRNELKYISPKLPSNINNYFEPFVGGGSVYTFIQANKYFINDKSDELIALYKLLKKQDSDFFNILHQIDYNWSIIGDVVYNQSIFFINTFRNFCNGKIGDDELNAILFDFIIHHTEEFNGLFDIHFNYNTENFIAEIKSNLHRKIARMKELELLKNRLNDDEVLRNIETAFKSAFYMHFRHIYNNSKKYKLKEHFKVAVFFLIRSLAYSGMFRYNSKGGFNVPYGGMGYNTKTLKSKIEYFSSNILSTILDKTTIENLDFEDFLEKNEYTKDDFIFLDPPYDSEFSTYAKNEFSKNDQIRLANYLVNKCKAKWMMIIKNTDFIYSLYNNKSLNIESFEKNYLVSFMNRNNKKVEHLIITNY